MSHVRFTEPARADMLQIWNPYAELDEHLAVRISDGFSRKFDSLLAFPGMGKRHPEISPRYQSFPEGSYVIYYQQVGDGIEIIRVLHGAQDVQAAFSDDPDVTP